MLQAFDLDFAKNELRKACFHNDKTLTLCKKKH